MEINEHNPMKQCEWHNWVKDYGDYVFKIVGWIYKTQYISSYCKKLHGLLYLSIKQDQLNYIIFVLHKSGQN